MSDPNSQRLGWRTYIGLFLLGIAVVTALGLVQGTPGYMDADYYFAGGTQLAKGQGFQERFIWNYLDDPRSLPHASHTYWMPLASILAAIFPVLTRVISFQTARIPFILLAGCISPLTAGLAFSFNHDRWGAIFAGSIAVFSGFYLPYLSTTDTFPIYMLLGTIFLLMACQTDLTVSKRSLGNAFLLGLISGLMHLARADGVIWFGFAILLFIWKWTRQVRLHKNQGGNIISFISLLALAGLGYFIIMAPWYVRNLHLYGSLMSPAGNRSLWIQEYDELFTYHADSLTIQHWLSTGWPGLIQARLDALALNLKTMVGVQMGIVLLPLIAFGLWKLRDRVIVRLGLILWTITFAVMTFVFPFAGSRGSFFHSGAALQPLFWAVAAIGMDELIHLGIRYRNWKLARAWWMYGTGFIGICFIFTLLITIPRVGGSSSESSDWNAGWKSGHIIDQYLIESGAGPDDIVAINNPASFYNATGRAAIVIPNGRLDALKAAAQQFNARYLVLEQNHVKDLDDLYQHPISGQGLEYLGKVQDAEIFRVENNE